MDILYQKMIQAFTDKREWFTQDELPYPKYIDFYVGQPDNPEEYEFSLPAIFMDYSVTWKLEGKIYVGTTVVDFHCVPPDEFPSKSNISPRQDKGLKLIRWYQTVAQVLDTVVTDHTARLRRAHDRPGITPYFKYHIMSYNSAVDALPGTERDKSVEGTIDGLNITGAIVKKFSLD